MNIVFLKLDGIPSGYVPHREPSAPPMENKNGDATVLSVSQIVNGTGHTKNAVNSDKEHLTSQRKNGTAVFTSGTIKFLKNILEICMFFTFDD